MAKMGVQFEIDADGILHVLARDIKTGNEKIVEMRSAVDVDDDDVQQMIEESVEHAFDDIEERRWVEAQLRAEQTTEATRKGWKPTAASCRRNRGRKSKRHCPKWRHCSLKGKGRPRHGCLPKGFQRQTGFSHPTAGRVDDGLRDGADARESRCPAGLIRPGILILSSDSLRKPPPRFFTSAPSTWRMSS